MCLCLFFNIHAQVDTFDLAYKFERCITHCNAKIILDFLTKSNFTKKQLLEMGTYISYHGNDKCGNELMSLCLTHADTITASDWHAYSVQNTKHGNYVEAIQALEKSMTISARDVEGYYGWVLLYYYRDYKNSLKHLNHYDSLTPQTTDAPVGENIHFLKGLCYYQLKEYQLSIKEFKANETFEIEKFGQKNCNAYIYFYIARNYERLNDIEKAEKYYKKTIKQSQFPVEAYYYLGMLYKYKKNNKIVADIYFKTAYDFLIKGYKQQDIYVELFDEVYASQIKEEFE